MTKYKKVPKFVAAQYAGGAREFKSKKRQQLKSVMREMDKLTFGIAYVPQQGYRKFDSAKNFLSELQMETTINSWGR